MDFSLFFRGKKKVTNGKSSNINGKILLKLFTQVSDLIMLDEFHDFTLHYHHIHTKNCNSSCICVPTH